MPPFPQWAIAIVVAASGVWAASQFHAETGWYLAIIIVLGVLLFRDESLVQLNRFIRAVFPASAIVRGGGHTGGKV